MTWTIDFLKSDRQIRGKSWEVHEHSLWVASLSHQLIPGLAGTILGIFAVLIQTKAPAWANKWPLTSANLAKD